jgi:enamine deaminase RidA (YjgF/YER057c/UK114 family)
MSAAGFNLPRAVEPDRPGRGVQKGNRHENAQSTDRLERAGAVPHHYTHALETQAGRTLFVSGQFGVARDGKMHADFPEQLGQAMDNVEALLSVGGMGLPHIAKATFFLTRTADLPVLGQVRRARWASDTPAAVTVIVVVTLARPDALVEVEVTAIQS